jgi:hypothetical protein
MKNLLYLLFVLPLLFSCDDENDNNGTQNNDYWRFKFTIDGVTHEAEGYGLFESNLNLQNAAYSLTSSPTWLLTFRITDPSSSSYVSGNNGGATIQIGAPSIGVVMCDVMSDWVLDAAEVSESYTYYGYSLTQGGSMVDGSNGGLGPKLPIIFTDLGSAGNGSWEGGTSIKGAYSGTIYLPPANNLMGGYTIPMDIDIEFEALRQ